jgi:hypothetical protein
MTTPAADPAEPAVVERLLRALERAEGPLSAGQLRQDLPGPSRPTPDQIVQILEDQVAEGRVHRFAPYRGQPRYWTRDLDHYCRAAIRKALARRPTTSPDLLRSLKAPLKGVTPERLRQILNELVQAGEVTKLPTFVRARTQMFSTGPPDPRDYVEDALREIYKKLEKAGVPRARVDEAALALLRPAPAAETAAVPPRPEPPPRPADDVDRQILDRMVGLVPDAARGALVSLRDLRQAVAAQVPGAAFDAAVLRLADGGRVALHRHDFPAGLSQEDRVGMVPDGRGGYYIGIALRA